MVVLGRDGGTVTATSVAVVTNRLSPAKVVKDLGTCVHLFPSIEIITNPAGRLAFVDMANQLEQYQSL